MQPCRTGAGGLRRGARFFGRFLSYQAAPYVQARTLRIVLADYEREPHDVSIVYPSVRLLPSRTRIFIEWMKRELQAALSGKL